MALAILDSVATESGCRFDRLVEAVKARIAIADADVEGIRDLVRLLQRDHYIQSDPSRIFRFRFPMVARWMQRGTPS